MWVSHPEGWSWAWSSLQVTSGPAKILMELLWELLNHNQEAKPLVNSWPTEPERLNIYSFKPLGLGVICYAALDILIHLPFTFPKSYPHWKIEGASDWMWVTDIPWLLGAGRIDWDEGRLSPLCLFFGEEGCLSHLSTWRKVPSLETLLESGQSRWSKSHCPLVSELLWSSNHSLITEGSSFSSLLSYPWVRCVLPSLQSFPWILLEPLVPFPRQASDLPLSKSPPFGLTIKMFPLCTRLSHVPSVYEHPALDYYPLFLLPQQE